MNITQIMGLLIGVMGLIGSALMIPKNVYEIRKLKKEIKGLKSIKENPKIYMPTLEDIFTINGNSEDYIKLLKDREKRRKGDMHGRNPFEIPVIDLSKTIRLPLLDGCKIPNVILENLRKYKKKAGWLTFIMTIFIFLIFIKTISIPSTVIFYFLPIPGWLGLFISSYVFANLFLYLSIVLFHLNKKKP